ncbi:Colicin D/E5 nuclease [Glarea lozoyensis ATCC 20868]|uniref:Colicin D/E5 nuclease n=2 Tax=Glarea lozoyensis TaxID=101852 RepID=S3DHC6_GLAL2|nr:Colicin D/E5 nuclease [Glarea lozoyensis ATCC 20868]EHK99314.1 hypothetical protein M7I_4831 [Glarea lozoyensis 74030]EPE36559.1 Colicin D/E5 nuclease [Glarea lozoyensis ATCC 20868]
MAFSPKNVTFPTANLQHMFDRHKAAWGYAGRNWNKATGAEFEATIKNFILNTPTVHAGTYRDNDAWLVIEQALPNHCAIVYRPTYEIWSGWELSAAQFLYANNPPYSLGGGALLVFGDVLERVLAAKDHATVDKLAVEFLDTYKANGKKRFDEGSEKVLMEVFAVLDNFALPEVVKEMKGSGVSDDIEDVKRVAQKALAVLEKHSDS